MFLGKSELEKKGLKIRVISQIQYCFFFGVLIEKMHRK
jgi:hypothetical protein